MRLHHVITLASALALVSLGAGRLAAHDGDHGSTQKYADSIMEKLRGIDGTLSKTGSLIAQLVDSRPADTNAPSSQMAASMRALLDEMRRLHGVTDDVMKQPGIHDRDAAMAALEKASRDLERMTSSLQSMAKNMSQVNKEATRLAQR